jgi:hypothetical protein
MPAPSDSKICLHFHFRTISNRNRRKTTVPVAHGAVERLATRLLATRDGLSDTMLLFHV